MTQKTVVFVFPDGSEHFCQYKDGDHRTFGYESIESLAEKAVASKGLKTSRKNPGKVLLCAYFLDVTPNGELKRKHIKDVSVTPPFERMTAEEFSEEMDEILSAIPRDFYGYVSNESYDRGHSAGYEECISIAKGIASELTPVIANYGKRMFENGVKSVSEKK